LTQTKLCPYGKYQPQFKTLNRVSADKNSVVFANGAMQRIPMASVGRFIVKVPTTLPSSIRRGFSTFGFLVPAKNQCL